MTPLGRKLRIPFATSAPVTRSDRHVLISHLYVLCCTGTTCVNTLGWEICVYAFHKLLDLHKEALEAEDFRHVLTCTMRFVPPRHNKTLFLDCTEGGHRRIQV